MIIIITLDVTMINIGFKNLNHKPKPTEIRFLRRFNFEKPTLSTSTISRIIKIMTNEVFICFQLLLLIRYLGCFCRFCLFIIKRNHPFIIITWMYLKHESISLGFIISYSNPFHLLLAAICQNILSILTLFIIPEALCFINV